MKRLLGFLLFFFSFWFSYGQVKYSLDSIIYFNNERIPTFLIKVVQKDNQGRNLVQYETSPPSLDPVTVRREKYQQYHSDGSIAEIIEKVYFSNVDSTYVTAIHRYNEDGYEYWRYGMSFFQNSNSVEIVSESKDTTIAWNGNIPAELIRFSKDPEGWKPSRRIVNYTGNNRIDSIHTYDITSGELLVEVNLFEFDQNGNVIYTTTKLGDNQINSLSESTFDDRNRRTSIKTQYFYNGQRSFFGYYTWEYKNDKIIYTSNSLNPISGDTTSIVREISLLLSENVIDSSTIEVRNPVENTWIFNNSTKYYYTIWNTTPVLSPPFEEFQIFPNPASQILQVKCFQEYTGLVRIHDLSGRLVYETKTDGKTILIPVDQLPTGMVFLQLDGQPAQKIVIQH